MFKKPPWLNPWGLRPKNSLSVDHLRYLCNVMSKNNLVTEQNKTLLVETLRQIAEILIWGDQNDSTVFDFFLEKNMLSLFLDIMKQKCGNYVTVQLLQTLNILFENIRNETSLYYLLSNNHVNSIITHKFDLSDEEVMAYYISFLKTLSFKLNPHTIHFFFNTSEFPLYSEAIKYFNHPEKMVRIAVRILTLNVFKVDEKSMLKFITSQTVPCLSDLVHSIRDNVTYVEKYLKDNSNYACPSAILPTIDDLLAEQLDHLHYLDDTLMLKIDDINRILTETLMLNLIKPLVDAYKEDSHNSMIRLFTLEFVTSLLSKVLNTNLFEVTEFDEELEKNIHNVGEEVRDRLSKDVKDCNDKQDLTNIKLSSTQLAIIEQSKEIAEVKVKALLKTEQQMAYLSLFETEYNDMRRKRLDANYLLMDCPNLNSTDNVRGNMDGARYRIRDFLLWRQMLLNIRNEKDKELSLKNTSWLSYAKLLQWLE